MNSEQQKPNNPPQGFRYIEFDDIDFGCRPVILDVRMPVEQRSVIGYLPGSMNIQLGELARSLDRLAPVKHEEIILVCLTGSRAETAAQILVQAGFTDVKVLKGGLAQVGTAQFDIKLKKPEG